jgi:hypothetical protein
MALDYSARRQVSRNRPKKRPARLFVLMILGGFCVVYGLGIATGWILSRSAAKTATQPAAAPPPVATAKQDARQAAGPAPAPGTTPGGGEPPLTFFNTLPKGEKAIMGSGINLQEVKASPAPGSATQTAATDKNTQQPLKPAKTEGNPASPEKSKLKPVTDGKPAEGSPPPSELKTAVTPDQRKQGPGKASYSVQVASYEQKNEADDMKARLEKQGLSARVVESKVPGKGVRYRVRVGRGMEQDGAHQLATRLGKSAMVIPE